MRLSDKTRRIISEMEEQGYVWLSHLDINTQMRFRNMTKKGFDKFVKVEGIGKNGLTFLTKEVAEIIKSGENKDGKRMTAFEQIEFLKSRVATLENENAQLKMLLGGKY